MVCFTVPLVTAIISSVVWSIQDRGPVGWWLNLVLYGGALFGVIDHIWFGEFLLGFQNLFSGTTPLGDLLLGFTITGAIFGTWGITLGMAKLRPTLGRRMGIIEPSEDL